MALTAKGLATRQRIIEGAALPLAGSAWITACAFTVLNAALLTVRLRCETRALAAAQLSLVSR